MSNYLIIVQDQLFDMIGDHSELLGVLLDLTSKMYKNFLKKISTLTGAIFI